MPDDPDPSTTDKSKWAAILSSIESPLQFFALPVLVVDAVIALAALALPESQRIYLLSGALGLLALIVLLVAAITFYRPANLQVLKEVLDGQAIRDVVVDVLTETLPDRLVEEYNLGAPQNEHTDNAPDQAQ